MEKKWSISLEIQRIYQNARIKKIEIAFLPMNLPYTMTPEMTARAVKTIKPKILYLYHYDGETDLSKFVELMNDSIEIEVRIRKIK